MFTVTLAIVRTLQLSNVPGRDNLVDFHGHL